RVHRSLGHIPEEAGEADKVRVHRPWDRHLAWVRLGMARVHRSLGHIPEEAGEADKARVHRPWDPRRLLEQVQVPHYNRFPAEQGNTDFLP
ncbi:MAG: hypothetical protein HQL74_07865, partial [Magnetococcales bacterium]|nr:hypothetical protein [Magnetococcales bacterium]